MKARTKAELVKDLVELEAKVAKQKDKMEWLVRSHQTDQKSLEEHNEVLRRIEDILNVRRNLALSPASRADAVVGTIRLNRMERDALREHLEKTMEAFIRSERIRDEGLPF